MDSLGRNYGDITSNKAHMYYVCALCSRSYIQETEKEKRAAKNPPLLLLPTVLVGWPKNVVWWRSSKKPLRIRSMILGGGGIKADYVICTAYLTILMFCYLVQYMFGIIILYPIYFNILHLRTYAGLYSYSIFVLECGMMRSFEFVLYFSTRIRKKASRIVIVESRLGSFVSQIEREREAGRKDKKLRVRQQKVLYGTAYIEESYCWI